MIEFRDPYLALGFLLAGIPLLLYLLERRRTPVVDWPATRFFLADLPRAVRWMQLKEALLIALRTLVIATLVAALLRPEESRPGSASGPERGRRGVVILLDNSYSMAYRPGGTEGPTCFEAARAAALEIIAALSPGDSVRVAPLKMVTVTNSSGEKMVTVPNFEDARAVVEGMALAGGGGSVLESLDLAADLAAAMEAEEREVYLITDLQAREWPGEDRTRWAFAGDRLKALRPAPRLTVLDVGAENPANRAVVGLSLKGAVAGAGRVVEVAARVAQFGDPARQAAAQARPGSPPGARPGAARAEVSLWVDGEKRESREVNFGEAGAGESVAFSLRFTEPGPHRVEARLDPDGLREDDVRYLAVDAVDRLPVLIVSGELRGARAGRRHLTPAEVLELALAPRLEGTRTPEVLFRPRVMGVEEFRRLRAAELAGEALIILAGLPRLERDGARLLEEYVRGGGGLLIFPGEGTSARADAEDLSAAAPGLLPARLQSLEGDAGAEREPARPQSSGRTVSPGEVLAGHPAFNELGPALRGELSKVGLARFWRVEPETGASVIARLGDGSPFMVEKSPGRGRSLLVTTASDPTSTDLAGRPVFVPLLHGLAYYLAGRRTGELEVPLGGDYVERLAGIEPSAAFTITDPAGGTRAGEAGPSVDPEGGAAPALTWGPVLLPGFYTVTGPRAGGRPVVFAANPDPAESDLRRIGADALANLAGELPLTVVRSLAELRPSGGGEPMRKEWWRPILAASIGLLILEVLFTRSLARGRAPWRPRARAGTGVQ